MQISYPEGATPLDPNELDGLMPQHLTTQRQLNRWEQANILEAEIWLKKQKVKHEDLLQVSFILSIHKRMFNKTWCWAGQFRKTDKNIGVDWQNIATELKLLLDDVVYQINHSTFSTDEICARFHHRLVLIHPFANGNGRHSRLATDTLLKCLGTTAFSWGSQSLIEVSIARKNYIQALREADKFNYQPLIAFVRS
jgi:Fic-DOC domain mobile mystery protein B